MKLFELEYSVRGKLGCLLRLRNYCSDATRCRLASETVYNTTTNGTEGKKLPLSPNQWRTEITVTCFYSDKNSTATRQTKTAEDQEDFITSAPTRELPIIDMKTATDDFLRVLAANTACRTTLPSPYFVELTTQQGGEKNDR